MCKDCGCESTTKVATLHVPGMMCENCENTVKTALLKEAGILSVDVDLKSKEVAVHFKEGEVTTDAMEAAVEATGFDVVKEDTKVADHVHTHGGVLGKIGRWLK